MASRYETIASEIVGVLVPYVVERRREMTYGELSRGIADRYGDNVPAWHAMAGPLGLVQEACKSLSLPNIPVMVVDQKTLRPAKGWYGEFDQLYPDLAGLDEVEKRVKARSDVLACADWALCSNTTGMTSNWRFPTGAANPHSAPTSKAPGSRRSGCGRRAGATRSPGRSASRRRARSASSAASTRPRGMASRG